jgi:deoxyadenosine/deoxycytidine kinase
MGNLSERDYIAYRKLFDLVVDSLPQPNLLVYLKCPAAILMQRIRKRARNMETGITVEYLSLLESFYEEWLLSFDLCPVLTIRTDDVDFVNQPMALELVVERIQEKLGGKEEIDFNEKLA